MRINPIVPAEDTPNWALAQGEIEVGVGNDGEDGILSAAPLSGRSMIELKAWRVGPGEYNTAAERFSLRNCLLSQVKSRASPLTLKDKLRLAVSHERSQKQSSM